MSGEDVVPEPLEVSRDVATCALWTWGLCVATLVAELGLVGAAIAVAAAALIASGEVP